MKYRINEIKKYITNNLNRNNNNKKYENSMH